MNVRWRHTVMFVILALVLMCPPLGARAQRAYELQPQLIVHLLDYVSVDYPSFVKDGKVVDADEYKEQQEFAAQVVTLLAQLPQVRERAELVAGAERLKSRIDARAAGDEVARLATELRWRVIGAYNVTIVPKRAPDLKRAASVYAAHCAACHGVEGRGDGPAAKGLDPAPANFYDRERFVQRSVYGLYNAITLGVSGTSMQGFAQLADDERWALAFFVGALSADPEKKARGQRLWNAGQAKADVASLRAVATLSENEVEQRHGADGVALFTWLKANPSLLDAAQLPPIEYSRKLLAQSAAAYRGNQRAEAQRLALSAYLEGFELAEAALDAVDRNLRQDVELQMMTYRDLMRRGAPVDEVEALARHIDAQLERSRQLMADGGLTPTTAALSSFFILLREGLEALLVVVGIAAFLLKAGRREALPWIHAGWIGAIVLGVATWFAASRLIDISGATREMTEGVTALMAAAILLYVGFWLHDKSHAHVWGKFIEQHLTHALERGTLWALAGVSFLAVYREAFETVLFYQALWQQAGEGAHSAIAVGLACAVGSLALAAWLIVRYGVRLPIGAFFVACSALMAVLAVVFTGHGIKGLQEADLIPASPIATISLPVLGVYPTVQTLLGQAVVLLVVVAMYAWPRAPASPKNTA